MTAACSCGFRAPSIGAALAHLRETRRRGEEGHAFPREALDRWRRRRAAAPAQAHARPETTPGLPLQDREAALVRQVFDAYRREKALSAHEIPGDEGGALRWAALVGCVTAVITARRLLSPEAASRLERVLARAVEGRPLVVEADEDRLQALERRLEELERRLAAAQLGR